MNCVIHCHIQKKLKLVYIKYHVNTRWFKYDRDWFFFCNHNWQTLTCTCQSSTYSPNPSRREGGGCGFTLSRSHSCCAMRLVYSQISPGHIWTTFYMHALLPNFIKFSFILLFPLRVGLLCGLFPPGCKRWCSLPYVVCALRYLIISDFITLTIKKQEVQITVGTSLSV